MVSRLSYVSQSRVLTRLPGLGFPVGGQSDLSLHSGLIN